MVNIMFQLLLEGVSIMLFSIYVYNSIIGVFGLFKKKHNTPKVDDKTKFLILIPCHNEEEVIYTTVKNIYNSDYDKDLFTIVPILDNCSDNSYNEVSKFTKEYSDANCMPLIVKGGSKPKAINEATKILKRTNTWNNYDSIIVIDADNIVCREMLWKFNYFHLLGEKILQCRILSHNDSTLVAKGFTSSFNLITHKLQIARNNIGLSASLCGTGFSVDRHVWDDVNFNKCESLTEDLEFSIYSIIKGYKIRFIKDVYVLNQNLEELKPSIIQRLRWCRGHMQVAIKCTPILIQSFFKKPSIQLLDSILFLTTPSRTTLYIISNTLVILSKNSIIPLWIVMFLFIYNLIYVLYCNSFKLRYSIPQLFYSICMQFIIVAGVLTYKKTHWVKTIHKKIDIN